MSMTTAPIPPDREDAISRIDQGPDKAIRVNGNGMSEASGKIGGGKDPRSLFAKRRRFKDLLEVDEIEEAESVDSYDEYV